MLTKMRCGNLANDKGNAMNVVQLQQTNFRDIAATLRRVADGIEQGDYGDVECAALVLTGQQTDVFHMGNGGVADAMMCLQFGIHKICAMAN